MTHFAKETIWIIGASAGIGKALATELAQQGATLILSARSQEPLDALNETLGGTHHVQLLDVSDRESVKNTTIKISEKIVKIDRVIFMAGLYQPNPIKNMDLDFAEKLIQVNLLGAMYLVDAILPLYEAQQSGQIVLCGSVSGYLGLPNGQPYSASKAALANYAESLHAEASDFIDVKLISPGFVRTRLTDKNDFSMPMRIEPEQAAKAIAKGLLASGFEIHFPKTFTIMLKMIQRLPYFIKLWLTKRMVS